MKATKDTLTITESTAPIAKTATWSSTGIDLANYGGNTVVLEVGVLTDGTFTPALEESDSSGSGYTAVAAADMVGTLAALTTVTNQKVSYIGSKRYIRVTTTVTGSPSTGAVVAVFAILTQGRKQP